MLRKGKQAGIPTRQMKKKLVDVVLRVEARRASSVARDF